MLVEATSGSTDGMDVLNRLTDQTHGLQGLHMTVRTLRTQIGAPYHRPISYGWQKR